MSYQLINHILVLMLYLLLGCDPCGTELGPSHSVQVVVWSSAPWLPPGTEPHGLIVLHMTMTTEQSSHITIT